MSTLQPPQEPPSSAEQIGSNEDLLTEILTHLPIKPLLKLTTTNKQFHHLISLPSFRLLHTLRHPHPPPSAFFLLLHPHSPLSPSFDLVSLSPSPPPPLPLPPSSPILHSCNGLLLLTSPANQLTLSNPTTNLSIPIPSPPSGSINLAFDPARWPHYYILSISSTIEVYSSRTGTWVRAVDEVGDTPFDIELDRGVYWRGRVFWLSHTDWTVYYDIERGCLGRLVLPRAIEGTYIDRFRYFGESRGRLHLIEIRTNCVEEFEVLELCEKEGGELEWGVKYRVNLDVVGVGFERDLFQDHTDRFGRRLRFYAFSILAVVRGGGEDGDDDGSGGGRDTLVLSIPGKVIAYDFKTKVSRLLCNVVDESDILFPFRGHNAFPFIPSLYCV